MPAHVAHPSGARAALVLLGHFDDAQSMLSSSGRRWRRSAGRRGSPWSGRSRPRPPGPRTRRSSALKPKLPLPAATLLARPTLPRRRRCRRSAQRARRAPGGRCRTPVSSSPSSFDASSRAVQARISATPPPGRMPSSTAARVACRASSTRAFFSFISASVAAPTLICGHAAGQLGQALLELLAVVVAGGRLDLACGSARCGP